jgi:hypothetical protein
MIGLPEAAQQLGIPYQSAHRLVLLGELEGEKRAGRWLVRLADVRRLAAEAGHLATSNRGQP